jgi:protein Mpv17
MFARYWIILLLAMVTSPFHCVVAWAPARTVTRTFQERQKHEGVSLALSFHNKRSERYQPGGRFPVRSSGLIAQASIIDLEDSVVEAEASRPEFARLANGGAIAETDSATMESIDYDELVQKIINGLILAFSFGYAIYIVFNIDHGMTRGWTQSEIAMRIPLDNWSNYESSLVEKPIYTKTLINVVIYLLGDWLSQTVFQKKNVLDFDAWRTLRNGFIGLCFGPLVHEYYQFSDRILPCEGGMVNRLEKILMDQTIYLTVKCSVYISAVGLLQGDDWDTVYNNVKERIRGIIFTAWKFWPLVHCITYGLIPARHRILWVNSVDLIWNAILSTMARNEEPSDESDADSLALASEELSAVSESPLVAGFHFDHGEADGVPSLREEHGVLPLVVGEKESSEVAGFHFDQGESDGFPLLVEEHDVLDLVVGEKENSEHFVSMVGNSTHMLLH